MAAKLQFRTDAAGVGVATLWDALTKDKMELVRKVAPDLLTESEFLEGDGIALGAVFKVRFGAVEFDEKEHLLSFEAVEGGFLSRGFTYYVVSFKLDEVGQGNTVLTTTMTYDLDKELGGAEAFEEFRKVVLHYVDSVVSYLQKATKRSMAGKRLLV
ncbi:hypothetical protein HPP92_011965 [Vanilla planifolia]|uniref:Bet v I/Major latex protein domain-containing protein n=1 Tax=Vanilla planifolia TaxID=51239 RepID=A0A835V5J0_VANPL|nr:hypothetical protein HPP92_011965 [Vanilla planifolia]